MPELPEVEVSRLTGAAFAKTSTGGDTAAPQSASRRSTPAREQLAQTRVT